MRPNRRPANREWPRSRPRGPRTASGKPLMVTPPGGCDHRGIPDPVNSLTPPSSEAEPRSDRWPGDAPAGSTRDGARPGSGWDVQIGTWGGWHAHRRHGGRGPFRRFGRGPLRRSSDQRIFGGVASGLADRCGFDVTLVRIAFVLLALCGGFGAAAYLVAVADPPDRGPGSGHRRSGLLGPPGDPALARLPARVRGDARRRSRRCTSAS